MTQDKKSHLKRVDYEIFLKKSGPIIDTQQMENEFNAFFKYASPKLAKKFIIHGDRSKFLLKTDKEISSFHFTLMNQKSPFSR